MTGALSPCAKISLKRSLTSSTGAGTPQRSFSPQTGTLMSGVPSSQTQCLQVLLSTASSTTRTSQHSSGKATASPVESTSLVNVPQKILTEVTCKTLTDIKSTDHVRGIRRILLGGTRHSKTREIRFNLL